MENAIQYISKIIYLIESDYKKIFFMTLYFILAAIFDLIGLGTLLIFIQGILNYDNFINSQFLQNISLFFPYLHLSKINFFFIIGLFLLTIFFIKTLISIYVQAKIIDYSLSKERILRNKLINHYINLDYLEFTKKNHSEYFQTLSGKVGQFSLALLSILRIFSDLTIALIIIAGLMYIDFFILFILVSSIIILLITYFFFFKNKIRKYGQDLIYGSNLMNEGLISIINGLKEIKILGIFRSILTSTEKGSEIVYISSFKDRLVQISPRYLLEFVLVLFAIIVVAIGILINRSEIELISLLGVFAAASLRLAPMSNQILSSFTTLQFSKASVEDVYNELRNIHNYKVKIKNTSKDNLNENFSNLKIVDGSFKYADDSPLILDKVNINIKKGEFVGIIGESGSGKSTLVDILLGLLDLSNGDLHINNKKFNKNKAYWQSKFAYIPQNIFLMNDTIIKNITFKDSLKEVDRVKFNLSIKKARLDKYINQSNSGIYSKIGDNGIRLSGGQRQRIAIARAFYFEREIFILDEATNALDKLTENEILQELKNLKKDKTIIMISHNIDVKNFFDSVFEISKNKINKL